VPLKSAAAAAAARQQHQSQQDGLVFHQRVAQTHC
jgi:hypothetical protein